MQPITDIANAIQQIERHQGSPEKFLLPIADSINDEVGVNMAIITTAILKRGWEPDGFEQRNGYRIYRYKCFE